MVSERDGSNNWIQSYLHFGGTYAALYRGGATGFIHQDHLGTTRLVTLADKSINDNMDFLPFGEQIAGSSGTTHKFTGKERDSESGLDNFGARYLSAAQGRWMTPDWSAKPISVPYAVFGNPQSLNLYEFVGNNPMLHGDPDGHCWPAAACVESLNRSLDKAVAKVQANSLKSSPTSAAIKTFAVGVAADTVKLIASPLTVGSATGACLGGNGCSAGQTALAVGGDVLKAAAIAAPLSSIGSKVAGAVEVAATTTVTHFTSDAGVQAITYAGGVLRGGGQAGGTFVAPASEIPGGATSSQVEGMLELNPGKGANSITFETLNSNLVTPGNGPTTSGQVTQFQLQDPVKIDPTQFTETPE